MRFTVLIYGDLAFRRATYGEVYAKIADHHSKSQRAAGFRIDLHVNHIDPGEEPPHYGGYAIIDNHEAHDHLPH